MEFNFKTLSCSILLIVGCFCLNTNMSSAQSDGSTVSLEDVIDGIRMRSQLLTNMSATMYREIYNFERYEDRNNPAARTLLDRDTFNVQRKGEKVRVTHTKWNKTSIEKDPRYTAHFAWDGSKSRGYVKRPKGTGNPTGGLIINEQGSSYSLGHYLAALEERIFDLNVSLASAINESTWTLVGAERLGQYSAVVVEGPAIGKVQVRAWVVPSRDYAPVKMRLTIPGPGNKGDIIEEMTDVVLQKLDGVWVCRESKILVHNPYVMEGWQAHSFSMKSGQVGVDLPDEHFVLKFPPGLEVWDETLKMAFKVRANGTLEPLYYAGEDPDSRFELGSTELPEGLENADSDPRRGISEPAPRIEDVSQKSGTQSPLSQIAGWKGRYRYIYVLCPMAIIAVVGISLYLRKRKRCGRMAE